MSLYYYIYCEKTFLTVFNLNYFTESCNFSLLVILNEKIEMSNTHSHTHRSSTFGSLRKTFVIMFVVPEIAFLCRQE